MKMSNIKLTNVPSMSVGKTVSTLAEAYSAVINNGLPMNTMPSVMLWGPPGVGKSQAVRQIASEITERTGKRVEVTDVRLLLFNPIDLRGIPTSDADKKFAIWLRPQIFDMDESSDVVNILFLDEISAAPQSVQAAAYQITLDKTVGEHKLPDNCIVIAAGNRTTDRSVAYKMPKALANRLMHIEVESTFSAWREWAVKAGVNPKVIGFLSFRQDYLMKFDSGNDDTAFPTPRSWEMVSRLLNGVDDDIDKMYPLIAGIVGSGVAIELRTWDKIYDKLPSVEKIFAGEDVQVPSAPDAMYALTSSMTAYAREHMDDTDAIANSIRFADKLPPDFGVILLKDYMYLSPDYKHTLMTIPEFKRWMQTRGGLLNAVV